MKHRVNINHSTIMVGMTNVGFIMQIMFLQLFFIAIISAKYWTPHNASNKEPFMKSERMKRAPFHRYIPSSILTATIKDGDEEIHVTWRRVERYLSNKNLPVYTVKNNSWGPTHRKSNVMNEVGETIMYQDIKLKSAVIYFENMDQLHGVVGKSYSIQNLPIDALSQPLVVGGPYVIKMKRHPVHGRPKLDTATLHQQRSMSETDTNMMSPAHPSTDGGHIPPNTLPEPFYIETLFVLTYDILQHARSRYQEEFLKGLILVCLLHFNAVDMIFAQLPTNEFEIYINLAGIIIEEEDGILGDILKYPALKYDGRSDLYVDGFLLDKIARYPNHFDFPFTKDSIDLILVGTGRELQSFDSYYPGLSWRVDDIFWKRSEDNQYRSVPTVLTTFSDAYSTYSMTARFIGTHLGIVSPDPYDKGITRSGMQCYGIMQMLNHHCTECLTWSDESISQLKVFFRENRNRCFLLNKPRSLHPPNTPIISVTPCRQCTCYGFCSYGEETLNECPLNVRSDSCDKPLECKYRNYEDELKWYPAILPLDGTPCGENKVCWNEECRNLRSSRCRQLL